MKCQSLMNPKMFSVTQFFTESLTYTKRPHKCFYPWKIIQILFKCVLNLPLNLRVDTAIDSLDNMEKNSVKYMAAKFFSRELSCPYGLPPELFK